ncbi:MAG: RidA family protein [Clostridiales bacterium]|nr:RidA family protein [Clostridiales bacterium]
MNIINTKNAPLAIGPYSQATEINGFIFVSGQLPINPLTGELVESDIKAMTRQSMNNIKAILESCGSSMDKILKTTVLVKDLSKFPEINEAYGEFFKNDVPARACFEVSSLPKGAMVEIEAIAHK